jgi:hypothetical protein
VVCNAAEKVAIELESMWKLQQQQQQQVLVVVSKHLPHVIDNPAIDRHTC